MALYIDHTMKRGRRVGIGFQKIKKVDDTILTNATPDMTFRDITATNKYMRQLTRQGKMLEGEADVDANRAKMNALNMQNLSVMNGIFSKAKENIREITWSGDYIESPLPKDINIPLEDLNYDQSIDALLPIDPTVFFYEYSNRMTHAFRRNYMIRETEFTPYGRLGVFNFSPFFDINGNWFTYGIREKYELASTLQERINAYTATMFGQWFPNDVKDKVFLQMLNKIGFTPYVANAYNTEVKTDSYNKAHNDKFLALLLNSSKLTWYQTVPTYVSQTDKQNQYSSYINAKDDEKAKIKIDMSLERIINDSIDLVDDKIDLFPIKYVDIDKEYNDVAKAIHDKLIPSYVKEQDLIRFRYLVYLWSFQNNVCRTLAMFVEKYESLSEGFTVPVAKQSGKQDAVYTMNEMATKTTEKKKLPKFDYIIEQTGNNVEKINKLFDKLAVDYRKIADAALGSVYLSDKNNFFNRYTRIHHKFISFFPRYDDLIFIDYKGKVKDNVQVTTDNNSDQNSCGIIEENKKSNNFGIAGKSIVFKFDIFTIILDKAMLGEERSAKITKDKLNDKSDITFENVIVLWDNNFIEFSNTGEDNTLWYEAYHTKGHGKVKNTKIDSACVMIRFRPDMNITYDYSTREKEQYLEKIHTLFRSCFYILDYYFTDENVYIGNVEKNDEGKNLVYTNTEDGIELTYSLTKQNNKYKFNLRDSYKPLIDEYGNPVMNEEGQQDFLRYVYYNDDYVTSIDMESVDPLNDPLYSVKKSFSEKVVDLSGKMDEIVQDDEWQKLIGYQANNNIGKDDKHEVDESKVMEEEEKEIN